MGKSLEKKILKTVNVETSLKINVETSLRIFLGGAKVVLKRTNNLTFQFILLS